MQKNLIDKRLLTLYDKNIKYTGSILNKNTTYKENDIISFEGAILKVTVAGTTDSTLKTIRTFLTTAKTGDTIVSGTATLKLMSLTDDIVIEDWKSKTNYIVNNVVINDKKIYRCTTAHTSTNTFDETKWEEISALENTVRPWATKTDYKANDLIYIDNVLYKCNTAHTSTTFSADVAKWDNMYSNIRDFANNTFYKKGSYVLYNNNIYKALKDTTGDISYHLQLQSSASFRDSYNTYTKVIGAGSQGVSLLTEPNGNYINTVIDLGNIYDITRIALSTLLTEYCDPCETIIETSTDGTSYIKANSFAKNYWDNTGSFQLNINEKARYIKIVFKSVYKRGGNGFTFKNVSIYTANTDWQKITNTQKPSIEAWTSSTDYSVNEVVIYNNKIYKCNKAHTSTTDFGADKLIYWNSLNDNPIINDWASGTTYEVGSIVIISNANNIPEWTTGTSYNTNDEVIYNGYIYTCKTANTDATFTESNWTLKEPVYNRIYRCIKENKDTTFTEANWQLINGDSVAKESDVEDLLL